MDNEGGMPDLFDENEEDNSGDSDVDLDDDDPITKDMDTSSAQAREGKDIQGIPWDRLIVSRESYRTTRLAAYKSHVNFPLHEEDIDKKCRQTEKGSNYYDFSYNTRSVKPTTLHFQLRNLLWATSKHDVYLMSNYSFIHWSSMSKNLSEVLNFAGRVAPTEKHDGSLLEGFLNAQISALAVRGDLMVAGGVHGELTCKRLDKKGVSFCIRLSHGDNSITNAVDIYDSLRGGINFMSCNNDCRIKEFDTERFQLLNNFLFPWPVNHTSISPDRKLVTLVGDNVDGLLMDSQTGKVVSSVVGHVDYGFASAWHPDGNIFSTGNQDKTCRVWDIRNLSSSVAVLKGSIGAIRSVRFSADGEFMVVAEPADFVHVYSTKDDYSRRQEIDFFGEVTGVALSPDDESLYIGIGDRTYASLLQYNRRHSLKYLDSYV